MTPLNCFKILFSTVVLTGACQVLASPQIETKPKPAIPVIKLKELPKKPLIDRGIEKKLIPQKFQKMNSRGGTGVDGGGGNNLGSKLAYPSQITRWVNESKIPARFVLERLELVLRAVNSEIPSLYNLKNKLFTGKENIYQALQKAQLQSTETEPCYDKYGIAVDGSAKDMPTICISAQRLSRALTEDTAEQEVLALVIHEVSHMLGTNEDEAQMLQYMVKSSLSKQPISSISSVMNPLKTEIQAVSETTNNLLSSLQAMDSSEICLTLGELGQRLMALPMKTWDLNQDKGFHFVSPGILNGLAIKAMNSSTFCRRENMNLQHLLDKLFGQRKEVSLLELRSALYPEAKNMPLVSDWTAHRVRNGDKNALSLELKDLQLILKNALDNF